MKVGGYPVLLIETEEDLLVLHKRLSAKKVFAFDTEFDRFRRRYGFNLLLLQIFDGEKVYLVKPSKAMNLKPFLKIFESPGIVKVVFSGGEDVQLLKHNEVEPVNLYELQAAAQITNHASKSYNALVEEVLGVQLDKSSQKSNWNNEVLTEAQMIYAASDVVYALPLYERLVADVSKRKMDAWVEHQNKQLEATAFRSYEPKISPKYRKLYKPLQQKKLLAMILETDRIAQLMDVPPYMVLPEEQMEAWLNNPEAFKGLKHSRRLHGRLRNAKHASLLASMDNRFIEIMDGINLPELPNNPRERKWQPEIDKEAYNEFKSGFKEYLDKAYGENTAEFLISGLKDLVLNYDQVNQDNLRKKLVQEYTLNKNINVSDLISK